MKDITLLKGMEDYEESFYLFEKECTERITDGKVSCITQSGRENLASLESTFMAYQSARSGSITGINSVCL